MDERMSSIIFQILKKYFLKEKTVPRAGDGKGIKLG
jgi:hypothetical protein